MCHVLPNVRQICAKSWPTFCQKTISNYYVHALFAAQEARARTTLPKKRSGDLQGRLLQELAVVEIVARPAGRRRSIRAVHQRNLRPDGEKEIQLDLL